MEEVRYRRLMSNTPAVHPVSGVTLTVTQNREAVSPVCPVFSDEYDSTAVPWVLLNDEEQAAVEAARG